MTDEVVEILERAAAKYADDLALQAVGENPPPEKADAVQALKKIIADAYFCGAAELWEVLEESKQEML
jgi:hypothetical protein